MCMLEENHYIVGPLKENIVIFLLHYKHVVEAWAHISHLQNELDGIINIYKLIRF